MIEIMVGMVVALLVGLAAAGSAQSFLASQRQGIGTGGAMVNSGTAIGAIRDDVAAAGLGFFGDSLYLCQSLNLSVGATLVQDGSAFTPVGITAETAGDRIDVVSATSVSAGANVLLGAASTGTSAQLRSYLPASTGQAVLLAPATPGVPCLVRTITAVAASTDTSPQTLSFDNTGSYNMVAFTTNPTYPDKSRVALLGDLKWSRYRLQGTDLRLERPLGGSPVVLVKNVVAFRAQYGLTSATAGSTALQSWQAASAAYATMTPALLPQVRALRVGMITRSPQPEKPAAGDNANCTGTPVTATMPSLFGQAATADVTNWRCYRYRTVVTVVPLRNLVMGITP